MDSYLATPEKGGIRGLLREVLLEGISGEDFKSADSSSSPLGTVSGTEVDVVRRGVDSSRDAAGVLWVLTFPWGDRPGEAQTGQPSRAPNDDGAASPGAPEIKSRLLTLWGPPDKHVMLGVGRELVGTGCILSREGWQPQPDIC